MPPVRAQINELFEQRVEKKLVDINSGEYVADADPLFDPRRPPRTASSKRRFKARSASVRQTESKTWVYLIRGDDGQLERVVLPIYGRGLWSTLYGFVALNSDLRTVAGLTYYEHAETPGLGGEVDNPGWKAKWDGKQIWAEGSKPSNASLRIGVAKGAPTDDNLPYQVDGLSGATITSRGVDSMLKYWFSQEGFGPYLNKLASEKGAHNG